jgi:MFS transporter, FSR family, fosmidomycin resistance protein
MISEPLEESRRDHTAAIFIPTIEGNFMETASERPDLSTLTHASTAFKVLGAIGFSHLLNDMIQSLIPAIYPLLKDSLSLNFTQIGLITLTFQVTASLLQPMVGLYTDHHPKPYSLSIGIGCTLIGLLILSIAPSYGILLIAAAMVGTGSSVFHPESSRVARMASGGRYGLAQSIFQVGGNAGSAIGPLLAAFIVIPHGQHSIAWFSFAALLAMVVLWKVGDWYKLRQSQVKRPKKSPVFERVLPHRTIVRSVIVLLALIFSKNFYTASITSYYMFYLITKFHLSVQSAQLHLFVFLSAVVVGTLLGGHIGDRIGRKQVIWVSILGAAPFALILPYANLAWTGPLTFVIGFILASAFPAIIVFAQELLPGKVGMASGLFYGFAFGMGGVGAAVLGKLADMHGIEYVYQICAYLPLLGLLTVFLPNIKGATFVLQKH